MAKSAPTDGQLIEQAWQASEPLRFATRFASPDARQLTKDLASGELPAELKPHLAKIPEGPARDLGHLVAMTMGMLSPTDEGNVVGQLLEGELIGLGFKLPRELHDQPVRIPQRVWTGKAAFRKNSVSGIGFTFVDVRVLPLSDWKRLANEALLPIPPDKGGRPGNKLEIYAAIEAEHAGNSVCETRRDPARTSRIRRRLIEMFPSDQDRWNGLNEETINKYRREFCRSFPASSNPRAKPTQ